MDGMCSGNGDIIGDPEGDEDSAGGERGGHRRNEC